jgi:type IV secretory pathway VirB4 component
MATKSKKSGKQTTQQYLNISEIKDDCVVLRDGTLVAVILISSINFSLKSAEEQEAIIQAYINFLNSIDFKVQIVIQSRKLNIDPYIEKLKKVEKEQTNELLKIQIAEYGNYILELVKIGQIMTKKFYITIPYNPGSDQKKKGLKKFVEIFSPGSVVRLKREVFLRRRKDLMHNVNNVTSGVSSMGLTGVLLDTQSLIELYYNIYNPTTAPKQPLDLKKMQIDN